MIRLREALLVSFGCIFQAVLPAQAVNSQAVIGSAGYVATPLAVAPGQLITLFLPNAGGALTSPAKAPAGTLPNTLSGFSAIFRQGSDTPMPILMVQPISTCGTLGPPPTSDSCAFTTAAVTVQIPYTIITMCPACERPIFENTGIAVAINGALGPFIRVTPVADQARILTNCDVTVAGAIPGLPTGLPCSSVVTHADGSTVTPQKPAIGGEELVAYATGLGVTDPPLATGQPATGQTPAAISFGIDFNYRPNALATKPAPVSTGVPAKGLVYVGATPGFAGLYQINFVVPTPPPGLLPCVDFATNAPGANVTQTNLTVSIGATYSFDGAGICVKPT